MLVFPQVSPLYSIQDPNQWEVTTIFRVALPVSVDVIQTIFHRHAQSFLSSVTVDRVKMIANSNQQGPYVLITVRIGYQHEFSGDSGIQAKI